jgi:molybdopterin converting factor small subunit
MDLISDKMELIMRVTVKLFATLTRFKSGIKAGTPFDIDLPEKACARDIIDLLKIPPEEVRVIFINNIIQEPTSILKGGDVVGIFPPVGGG